MPSLTYKIMVNKTILLLFNEKLTDNSGLHLRGCKKIREQIMLKFILALIQGGNIRPW